MADGSPPERVAWPADRAAQEALLRRAVETLRSGGLVVFPTDTVYGIGADPSQSQAVASVYELKGRPPGKQIAWLVSGPDALGLDLRLPPAGRVLTDRYWPGPLTLVLPDGQGGSIGLRVPDHPLTLALLRAFGGPLATTSANRSAAGSVRTADQVLEQLPGGYALLIDGGACPGGVDSTVVDVGATPPRVLREGAISTADIEACLGSQQGAEP